MNVGIDIDHTITDSPTLLRILCKGLLAEGHFVSIISWRESLDKITDTLREYAIPFSVIVYPTSKEREGKDPYSHGVFVGKDSAAWKRKIAIEHKIDIMIDDSPEVLKAMPDNVQTFWLLDRKVFNLEHALQGMRSQKKIMEK